MSVIEIREILRRWLQGRGLHEVARLSGTDRKTVRRYLTTDETKHTETSGMPQVRDNSWGTEPSQWTDGWLNPSTRADKLGRRSEPARKTGLAPAGSRRKSIPTIAGPHQMPGVPVHAGHYVTVMLGRMAADSDHHAFQRVAPLLESS